MDKKKTLQDIFDDEDDFGLLDVKPKANPVRNEDERLVSSFKEINQFFEKNNREPQPNNVQEFSLYSRLKGIRENEHKKEALLKYDTHHLLIFAKKEINSFDDIFEDDSLGLLESEAESIFDLKNVPTQDERESAEYIARRKPCKDFEEYEQMFKSCQQEIKLGKRNLIPFLERYLKEGTFFIQNGILVYLEKISDATKDKNGKIDGRTRCIFENGTESDMLLRSLGKGLYENGFVVSEDKDMVNESLMKNFNIITEEDKEAGFIYVLKSKSNDPKIKTIPNLYKIGFSKIAVEERIKNAENEPTYLMASVSIVTAFKCYNMNPQKLEQLLHTFFGSACLNIDIFDKKGVRHTPREWFIAPIDIIQKSIELIISGEVIGYKYDVGNEIIVNRG